MFCHNCGKQIPDGIKFCNYCGAAQEGDQSAPASAAPPPVPPVQPQSTSWQAQPQQAPQQASWQAQPQPAPQTAFWQTQPEPQSTVGQTQERVLPGILGALLCSLAGVVFMVLLRQIGYVSSLSGIIMLACTAWGYAHFGKTMSTKGIVFSILIVIAMIYVGNRFCWAIIVRRSISPSSPFTDILFYFLHLPLLGRGMAEAYQRTLFQQYSYAAVGVIFLVVYLVRGNRAGKK